eukprot:TRINITY_DN19942_c0_g1_i3.p2 TRINITY_DN19942_c0_g1~~TRINITY_DN19942_c0_g1_i3.p2  ORF type:complete len:198 (-),score=57.31 TRINITY_DN19942_c0_g1_i3:932-1525(-)
MCIRDRYNFEQYLQVVGAALANPGIGGSQACYDLVAAGVSALNSNMFESNNTQAVPALLQPCSEMKTDSDKYQYQSTIYGYFQGAVQYNEETPSPTVGQVCKALTAESAPLLALEAAVKLMAPTQECTSSDFQKDMVDAYLSNTSFSGVGCGLSCASTRQWIYMSCNEFGYFQTASGNGHPFTAFQFFFKQKTAYEI